MKTILVLILSVSLDSVSLGQQVPIEYKGSYPFDIYLMRQLTIFKNGYQIGDTLSKYFDAIIEFNASGKIVSLSIFSENDDSLAKSISRVILATDGQWKNNLGKTVFASQKIFWEFMGNVDNNKNLKFQRFVNGKGIPVYELKPFKSEFAKPVR